VGRLELVGLGGGMNGDVLALAVYDDGGGPALYAGGGFNVAGDVPANHIAKWDGSQLVALGSAGADEQLVDALAVYDDGGGPALYAAGSSRARRRGGEPDREVGRLELVPAGKRRRRRCPGGVRRRRRAGALRRR
jgi:hypothetical protein